MHALQNQINGSISKIRFFITASKFVMYIHSAPSADVKPICSAGSFSLHAVDMQSLCQYYHL